MLWFTKAFARDKSTNATTMIEYEHHEIHSGSHYFITDFASFSNAEVMDFTFVTPDSGKQAHFVFSIFWTGAVSVEALVGAVVDTTWTVISPVNNNGNSSNTSIMTVRHWDTFTSEWVSKLRSYAGANKVAGTIERTREILLASNQTYILRVTNELTTANIITWNANRYEHTEKNV